MLRGTILFICFTLFALSAKNFPMDKPTPSSNQSSDIFYNIIELSEGKSTKVSWKETVTNGERKIAIQNQSYTETSYGTDTTNRWEYTVPSTGETMSVTVKDKEATILSSKKDPQVINLFDSVLMYPPSFYAKDFLKSSKKKRYFLTINRKDVKLQQIVFNKLGK